MTGGFREEARLPFVIDLLMSVRLAMPGADRLPGGEGFDAATHTISITLFIALPFPC